MFKSRDPFEIVRGLNDYPCAFIHWMVCEAFINISSVIILFIWMIGYQIPKSVLFWLMSLDICFYIKKQMQFLWIPERSSMEPDTNEKLICLLWNFCFRMKCCLNIRRWGIQLIRYPALQDIIKD